MARRQASGKGWFGGEAFGRIQHKQRRMGPRGLAEAKQLRKYSPCLFPSREDVVNALAEVHVEFMLIHSFREGNGRLGRLLAILMALQAGLPILEFSEMVGSRREEYFAAVRAGLDMNYKPMQRLFSDVIQRSLLPEPGAYGVSPLRGTFHSLRRG